MVSFISIPYSDIITLLNSYSQSISDNESENYQRAWNFLNNNNLEKIPVSIADFIVASHLTINEKYKTSDILFGLIDLKELSQLLGLDYVDRERIIRILGYLNKLDNDRSIYESLPHEILKKILMELDCPSISLFL